MCRGVEVWVCVFTLRCVIINCLCFCGRPAYLSQLESRLLLVFYILILNDATLCILWSAGCLYSHGHITRAMCCRLSKDIANFLPSLYQVTHPYLGRVTTPNPRHAESDPVPDSINWSFGDEKIEILSRETGKSCER